MFIVFVLYAMLCFAAVTSNYSVVVVVFVGGQR